MSGINYVHRRRRSSSITLLSIVCVEWAIVVRSSDIHTGHCRDALGMRSGAIPDESLTASSSLDPVHLGPANARIHTELNGGAWCPREHISKNVIEFIEIDFNQLKVITLVETQGRFGNGQDNVYVEQYSLQYQRDNGGRWFTFKNRRGQEIFQGNANAYSAELRDVDPPIIARRLRVLPYSLHAKQACLRLELYGCHWEDGVIEYNMVQGARPWSADVVGSRKDDDLDLSDETYDGQIFDGRLSGGLGQLTDGEEGQSNFRLDKKNLGIKGYEWVGWTNDTTRSRNGRFGRHVDIRFKFDAVRNFTSIKLHCNNRFSRDVRVFRLARAIFSMTEQDSAYETEEEEGGGKDVQVLEYGYARDAASEYARVVEIPVDHLVGRYISIQLYFDARWIMISEVQFESEYATVMAAMTTEEPVTSSGDHLVVDDPSGLSPSNPSFNVSRASLNGSRSMTSYQPNGKNYSNVSSNYSTLNREEQLPHLIPQDPEASNLLLLDDKSQRAAVHFKPTFSDDDDHNDDDDGPERTRVRDTGTLNDEHIGIIIGTLATLILVFFAVGIVLFMMRRHRHNKYHRRHHCGRHRSHHHSRGGATNDGATSALEPPPRPAVTMASIQNIYGGMIGGGVNSGVGGGGGGGTCTAGGGYVGTPAGKVVNGNVYNFVATSDGDSDQTRQCLRTSSTTDVTPFVTESDRDGVTNPVWSRGRVTGSSNGNKVDDNDEENDTFGHHFRHRHLRKQDVIESDQHNGQQIQPLRQTSQPQHNNDQKPSRLSDLTHLPDSFRVSYSVTSRQTAQRATPAKNDTVTSPNTNNQKNHEVLLNPPILKQEQPNSVNTKPTPPSSLSSNSLISRTLALRDHGVVNRDYKAATCVKSKRRNISPTSADCEEDFLFEDNCNSVADNVEQNWHENVLSPNGNHSRHIGKEAASRNGNDDILCSRQSTSSSLSPTERLASNAATAPRRGGPVVNGWTAERKIIEVPRQSLKYIDRLGSGRYGEVYLCEITVLPLQQNSRCGRDDIDVGAYHGPTRCLNSVSRSSTLVAVRVLQSNADETTRLAFFAEARLMSCLDNSNIVRLVGACTVGEPRCLLIEYLKYGKLDNYIKRFTHPGTASESLNNTKVISHGALLYLITQIASAMKCLESHGIVHRRLSTRACLIGEHQIVKLSDFGDSSNINECSGFSAHVSANIRWMAWESAILGQWTSQSDVWSFGMTMWEVLTLAKERPLGTLSDAEVFENLLCYYDRFNKDNQNVMSRRLNGFTDVAGQNAADPQMRRGVVCPLQPPQCPRELYDLMRECWNGDIATRPTFDEIHAFLSRKNAGYRPPNNHVTSCDIERGTERQITRTSVLV